MEVGQGAGGCWQEEEVDEERRGRRRGRGKGRGFGGEDQTKAEVQVEFPEVPVRHDCDRKEIAFSFLYPFLFLDHL